jgi:hypothetical protein
VGAARHLCMEQAPGRLRLRTPYPCGRSGRVAERTGAVAELAERTESGGLSPRGRRFELRTEGSIRKLPQTVAESGLPIGILANSETFDTTCGQFNNALTNDFTG